MIVLLHFMDRLTDDVYFVMGLHAEV